MDFSKYTFRCSQLYKLMAGDLPQKGFYLPRIEELKKEKETLVNKNGNKVKWTDNKADELAKITQIENTPVHERLPKTMKSELRKIHRMETYKRNFPFTNKYVQKGIQQEEESITNYQIWLMEKGQKVLFRKNDQRFYNEWINGEPDILPNSKKIIKGWDTKSSWDLSTFPFHKDPLDAQYEAQNQGYMWLTGAEKWTTVYCLVNSTEHQLNNEKMKWFYAFNMPDEDKEKEQYDLMVEKQKEVERMMVFDWNRFQKQFPYHDMIHTKEEWFDKGYDIPLKDRIIEKTSFASQDFRQEAISRIKIGREYLKSL